MPPNPPHQWFSERSVQFRELTFNTQQRTEDTYYELRQLKVVVNSQRENALAHSIYIKPKTTTNSDGEERELSSTKLGQSCGVPSQMSVGLQPHSSIKTSATKTNEKTVTSDKNQFRNQITACCSNGEIQWDFDIDDVRSREVGPFITDDHLPTVRFMYIGEFGSDEDESAPPDPPLPPENMDIEITSFWKMISPSASNLKSPWYRKLLDTLRPSASDDLGTQTLLSYSNLLQIVALNITDLPRLSKLPKPASYQAKVEFKPGTDVPHNVIDIHKGPKSVVCVPSVLHPLLC